MLKYLPLLLALSAAQFTPPPSWEVHREGDFDLHAINTSAKAKIKPNAILVSEPFEGTAEEYLTLVEEINRGFHSEQLESISLARMQEIETASGPAKMVRLDAKTPVGDATFFQAFVIADGNAYTVTAGSSKECFYDYVGDFLGLIRSLAITDE